jgi:hypothetical protein
VCTSSESAPAPPSNGWLGPPPDDPTPPPPPPAVRPARVLCTETAQAGQVAVCTISYQPPGGWTGGQGGGRVCEWGCRAAGGSAPGASVVHGDCGGGASGGVQYIILCYNCVDVQVENAFYYTLQHLRGCTGKACTT